MNGGCDDVPENATLHPNAFASKNLSITQRWYSNFEWKALGILNGLENFLHYCLAQEVYILTDHKPLVAIVNKNVAVLSLQLKHIMLLIHQYSMHIFYKPGPDLYIADRLSHHNHADKMDQEIML